jgi:hypothetical protein
MTNYVFPIVMQMDVILLLLVVHRGNTYIGDDIIFSTYFGAIKTVNKK